MLEVIDLISHVRNLEGTFPKREQRVANFMLANLERISFLSQHEIAEATEVSVATVNRFCTTIGCEGFRDFQIRLAQNVAVSLQYLEGSSGDQSEGVQETCDIDGCGVNATGAERTIHFARCGRRWDTGQGGDERMVDADA